ncbi:hypothetical protein [Actinomadura litoris]|uniref:Uncharacterized protein n=1 Tax=Actinomadura litoris TaxID=2678616 RepID=A0A7K1LAP8_9ACTN|nr:hypothetical protein [Actinomadura litoris]MUN41499.1 hypothetical protein [Actinomadura litoris]
MQQITDPRREVEVLAYQVRSHPGLSAAADLTDIAPGLSDAARTAAFGDLIDGIGLRDAAKLACEAGPEHVAAVLTDLVDPRLAARVTGVDYPALLATARTRTAIIAADYAGKAGDWDGEAWDRLDRLDENVDGALGELADVQSGNATAADYPDADPDRLAELVQEKVTAALACLAFDVQHRLDALLTDFTVAAWRFADAARMRLTGGAR